MTVCFLNLPFTCFVRTLDYNLLWCFIDQSGISAARMVWVGMEGEVPMQVQ